MRRRLLACAVMAATLIAFPAAPRAAASVDDSEPARVVAVGSSVTWDPVAIVHAGPHLYMINGSSLDRRDANGRLLASTGPNIGAYDVALT